MRKYAFILLAFFSFFAICAKAEPLFSNTKPALQAFLKAMNENQPKAIAPYIANALGDEKLDAANQAALEKLAEQAVAHYRQFFENQKIQLKFKEVTLLRIFNPDKQYLKAPASSKQDRQTKNRWPYLSQKDTGAEYWIQNESGNKKLLFWVNLENGQIASPYFYYADEINLAEQKVKALLAALGKQDTRKVAELQKINDILIPSDAIAKIMINNAQQRFNFQQPIQVRLVDIVEKHAHLVGQPDFIYQLTGNSPQIQVVNERWTVSFDVFSDRLSRIKSDFLPEMLLTLDEYNQIIQEFADTLNRQDINKLAMLHNPKYPKELLALEMTHYRFFFNQQKINGKCRSIEIDHARNFARCQLYSKDKKMDLTITIDEITPQKIKWSRDSIVENYAIYGQAKIEHLIASVKERNLKKIANTMIADDEAPSIELAKMILHRFEQAFDLSQPITVSLDVMPEKDRYIEFMLSGSKNGALATKKLLVPTKDTDGLIVIEGNLILSKDK